MTGQERDAADDRAALRQQPMKVEQHVCVVARQVLENVAVNDQVERSVGDRFEIAAQVETLDPGNVRETLRVQVDEAAVRPRHVVERSCQTGRRRDVEHPRPWPEEPPLVDDELDQSRAFERAAPTALHGGPHTYVGERLTATDVAPHVDRLR